jgi:hypothetical protein
VKMCTCGHPFASHYLENPGNAYSVRCNGKIIGAWSGRRIQCLCVKKVKKVKS